MDSIQAIFDEADEICRELGVPPGDYERAREVLRQRGGKP